MIAFSSYQQKVFIAPLIGLVIGAGMIAFSALHWYWRWQSLSLSHEVTQLYANQAQQSSNVPNHLQIENLVDTAVQPQVYTTDQRWTVAENEASYWLDSARPGQPGNLVIYGHNKPAVLGNLLQIKEGDEIILTTERGQQYKYQVAEWQEVTPSETKWLKPTTEPVLTIYTCSGWLDQKRFIVRATPIKS